MHEKIKHFCVLMRWNKPIGFLLLLWPTLWALWLAARGNPPWSILFIFIMGVILMRSAGCIINDIADRKWDAHVVRTKERPLAAKKLSVKEALYLFFLLITLAFLLILFLNWLSILLAIIGLLLAIVYPYLKRVTHLPQVGLGFAFSWGIPMAFAAVLGFIPPQAWLLFIAAALWPIIYDTYYAMTDKADDVMVGIKSTAILFDKHIILFIGLLQTGFILLMALVGMLFYLGFYYYFSLLIVSLFFFYQEWLIKDKKPEDCFKAFLNNNWVGFIIFLGIFLDFTRS